MLLASLLTAVTFVVGGVFFYRHEKVTISSQIIDQIRFSSAQKIVQITAWRDERLRDADRNGVDPFLRQSTQDMLVQPSDLALRDIIQNYLKMLQSEENYQDVILTGDGGKFLLSATGQKPPDADDRIVALTQKAFVSDQAFFAEFAPCHSCPQISLDVVVALEDEEHKPMAALILRTDVRQSLYPILESWQPSPSSVEIILVRRDGDDVLILSPHQHKMSPQIGARIPLTQTGLPAVQAALGATGIFYGSDARGVAIVADLQPIPGTDWVMVAKVDQSEILAEAQEHGWFIAGLTGLSLLMTATMAAFLFNVQQRKIFRSLYLAEQEKRVADEALVESAKRLAKLNRIYKVLNEINQAIIRERNPEDLFIEACRIAEKEGGFPLAWVGVLEEQTQRITPVAHSGITDDYLPLLDIVLDDTLHSHHPAATSFRTGETVVINDIESDPLMEPWRQNALLSGYRSLAVIPLTVAGQVKATFNLYSYESFSFDQDEIRLLDEMVGDMSFALEFMEQEKKRRAAENELRKLSRAMEQSPVSIVITSTKGEIEYVNPKFLQVTGYAMEEVLGVNPRILKSGETSSDEYRTLWQTIIAGGEWHGEFHNRKKDGSLFWERAAISPIFDAAGQISNFLAIKEDITDQKVLEEELAQSQRLETVGQLAGGVAHDFNNMLGVILGSVDLALDRVKADDPLGHDLLEIRKAAEHSADLTRQLLGFARKQIIRPRTLDLNVTIDKTLSMLGRLLGEDITLHWRPAPELWSVTIDPSQIEQILVNIAVNARDAMSGGGELIIETTNAVLDESYCVDKPECHPGNYVMIRISDNGEGMTPAILARIFEPFFTTKSLGQATGMGLATIYGIVKQNKGCIIVSSTLGAGTTFRIYLPRTEAIVAAKKDVTPGDQSRIDGHGSETILLVEDEPAILELAKRILVRSGYRVLPALNPSQALELAASHAGPLHLLISDVVMPEMSGKELAEQLSGVRPETKILFMSGYTAEVIARHGVQDNAIDLIRKPFAKKDLLSKIRQILDS